MGPCKEGGLEEGVSVSNLYMQGEQHNTSEQHMHSTILKKVKWRVLHTWTILVHANL